MRMNCLTVLDSGCGQGFWTMGVNMGGGDAHCYLLTKSHQCRYGVVLSKMELLPEAKEVLIIIFASHVLLLWSWFGYCSFSYLPPSQSKDQLLINRVLPWSEKNTIITNNISNPNYKSVKVLPQYQFPLEIPSVQPSPLTNGFTPPPLGPDSSMPGGTATLGGVVWIGKPWLGCGVWPLVISRPMTPPLILFLLHLYQISLQFKAIDLFWSNT